jgi:uncharacterized protein YjiS (DUF1127 family)
MSASPINAARSLRQGRRYRRKRNTLKAVWSEATGKMAKIRPSPINAARPLQQGKRYKRKRKTLKAVWSEAT